MDVIWGKREGKYFLVTDWTGGIALIRFDKFAFARRVTVLAETVIASEAKQSM
jgi:hypothetical protein